LRHSNPFRIEPFWFALDSHQKVIKVHDSMNSVVDGAVNQSWRTVRDEGVPGTQQYRDVMVPVQQHEIFLVCNNEKGIE